MDRRFEGKVVLVTGGNRNTGLWLVKRFVDDGARVFMCGSSEDSTRRGVEALKAMGVDGVVAQACDVGDKAQVDALMDRIERRYARHTGQQRGGPGAWARGAA